MLRLSLMFLSRLSLTDWGPVTPRTGPDTARATAAISRDTGPGQREITGSLDLRING